MARAHTNTHTRRRHVGYTPPPFVLGRRALCVRARVRAFPCVTHAALYVYAACYDSVTVSGAEATAQASRMGTYTKVAGLTEGDRPVYKRVGSSGTVQYLSYRSTGHWAIGPDYASDQVGVRSSRTEALCPNQVTDWQAWSGVAWVSAPPITVSWGVTW
jgi:hypothetical protein